MNDLETKSTLWSESVLLPDGWARNVAMEIDRQGTIQSVRPGSPPASGVILGGAVIPGIPNLHSHAHQRAMAGLGERASDSTDSFWTWRKIMYHYLERIRPDDLYHISRMLYLEMLKSGYTSVAEFQYLHHDVDGRPFSSRAEMTLQCLHAANQVGIGFTALPVLYGHGGFGGQPAQDGQKRFLNDQQGFCQITDELLRATENHPDCNVGVAPHSLRAITRPLLQDCLCSLGQEPLAAIHIHIAEQVKEVEDCLAWSNRRPVEWLFDHFEVNQQWCLIHATHMTGGETDMLAASGAVAGLCPTTEANLGDGMFNAGQFVAAGGRWGIGSDSQISVSPVEELRWLEYGQRLSFQRRNLLAAPGMPNTGRALLDSALNGGAQACGRKIGRIEAGYRADLVIIDDSHPRLYQRSDDDLIDSWIFSGNDNAVTEVFVGGEKVISEGRHLQETEIRQCYYRTLDQLAN